VAGILDPKSRIMDVVLTEQGKRQIASGELRIEFAGFTDKHTFYQRDVASGSDDATTRLYFEAIPLPFDQVTFETDDSGKMINYTGGDLELRSGRLWEPLPVTTEEEVSRFVESEFTTSGGLPGFASLASGIVTSSIDNFRRLQYIGTDDIFFGKEFSISQDRVEWIVGDNIIGKTSDSPFNRSAGSGDVEYIDLDNIEPFFLDMRMQHLPNFRFLPPMTTVATTPDSIGSFNYTQEKIDNPSGFLGEYTIMTPYRIETMESLEDYLANGQATTSEAYGPGAPGGMHGKSFIEIDFEGRSRQQNLVCQMFEMGENELKKLDVIDFGVFFDQNTGNSKHIFFCGKVFIDEVGLGTFINLFTLSFERNL